MQNLASYPLARPVTQLAPPSAGVIAYLRSASLALWFLSLIAHLWWVADWYAMVEIATEGTSKDYFYVGFGIAVIAHLTAGLQAWLEAPFAAVATWPGRFFTAFCVLMFVMSPISEAPRVSAMYALATSGVYLLFCVYWRSNYQVIQRTMSFTGVVVLLWVLALLFKHGLSGGFGSSIGGINRNTTSFAAVGGMICLQFSSRKQIRLLAFVLAIALAALVSSRGALLAIGTFGTVYYFLQKGSTRATLHAILALFLVGAALITMPEVRERIAEDVFRLHDASRGLGSGFSGRTVWWQQAIEAYWKRPLTGYGFRSGAGGGDAGYGGVHSGYLRLFLEGGFIGGCLVVGTTLLELGRRCRLVFRLRRTPPGASLGIDVAESMRVNSLVGAMMAMTMVIWVYEQLYVNLGSIVSLLFFLMLAAPAYITTQGVALRR